MASQVILFVADDNYLDHAKSVMVNCRRQGEWTGNFCMISPAGCANSDFERRGIHVLRVPDEGWDFMVKFHAFTEYFHQWDQALCIDLDIIVQRNLHDAFDELAPRLPAILCAQEDGPILGGLKHWDATVGEGPDAHPEVYEEIERRFPHVTQRMFNMGFIFYQPSSMPPETMSKLRELHAEFSKANPTNADQMLVNLLLYDKMEEAGKDACTFFGNDYPGNRVASEFRGWTGDEHPAILHYTRWYAPWIVKHICNTPEPNTEPGGYRNHRLGRLCHELYADNLAAFNEEFPI
jgi:hypothetical protein